MSPLPGQRARIAVLLVSHSDKIAEGTRDLAAQMAPGVLIVAVGGMPGGGLGTDFEGVSAALADAGARAEGVVVISDLGSAVMTVESALDFADEELASRARLADAPFVEGAVAAAVTAHGGGTLDEVLASAQYAGSTFAVSDGQGGPTGALPPHGEEPMSGVTSGPHQVEVRNPLGIHARPAAVLSRLVAGFDARVTIGGVNAASVLELMKLGAVAGQVLEVDAHGPAASEAIAAVVEAIAGGFGEV